MSGLGEGGTVKEVLARAEEKMKHAAEHFHEQLKHLRTGRASTGMVEHILVDYYGQPTPLRNVANLTVADATMLVAQPWDPGTIAAIERAILKSDLGINPQSDGKVIRLPVPPLTAERRKELVRKAHDLSEHARNVVRQIRRDANEIFKRQARDGELGEDEEHRAHEAVQKLHDRFIAEIGQALQRKERDILGD